MEQLTHALELVREAVARATPSPETSHAPAEQAASSPEPTNEHYRELNTDCWYRFKPDQHISAVKLQWADPDRPVYATFLKPEVQAGNPMMLGSMGPGHPVYGENLHAKPYHAAEPKGFKPQPFNMLANPLDPRVDRAIATLGDLGVTAEIFRLRQLPMKHLENARQVAYLEREAERIQREIGYHHLAKGQLEAEEASIRRRLTEARVFMRISDHLDYDREPGEVPSSITYPNITTRPARYNVNVRTTGRPGRATRGNRGQRQRTTMPREPCLYCRRRLHAPTECTQPHTKCTREECHVPPVHARFEPRYVCPYYAAHMSGRGMTPAEEAYALDDLFDLDEYMQTD